MNTSRTWDFGRESYAALTHSLDYSDGREIAHYATDAYATSRADTPIVCSTFRSLQDPSYGTRCGLAVGQP